MPGHPARVGSRAQLPPGKLFYMTELIEELREPAVQLVAIEDPDVVDARLEILKIYQRERAMSRCLVAVGCAHNRNRLLTAPLGLSHQPVPSRSEASLLHRQATATGQGTAEGRGRGGPARGQEPPLYASETRAFASLPSLPWNTPLPH